MSVAGKLAGYHGCLPYSYNARKFNLQLGSGVWVVQLPFCIPSLAKALLGAQLSRAPFLLILSAQLDWIQVRTEKV